MADLDGTNGQRSEFNAVGRANVPGRLSYSMATGMAKYGGDAVVPDMLHAKYLRSPYGRVNIKSMDVSKAKALQGVVEIVTWDDPEAQEISSRGAREPLIPRDAEMENQEIGAIVVAETPEICDEALKLIDVEWEVFPTVTDALDGIKPGAPTIKFPPRDPSSASTGDVETAFREADHVVEFDWAQCRRASHPPNPNVSVAWWGQDPWGTRGDTLYIEGVCPTWGSFELRPMYNVTYDKLFRKTLFQGGRYCDWFHRRSQMVTPFLSKRTGRPVRCANEREHEYYPAGQQRVAHVKLGFNNDGLITAVEESVINDSGSPRGRAFGWGGSIAFSPFNTTRCVNIKSNSQSVFTNSGYGMGSQTSPFDWDAMTYAEQAVAEKLGMDVLDVALKNVHGPASQQDPGIPPGLQMCIEKGKKIMNWEYHPAGAKKLADGRLHGYSFRYALSPRHAQQPYTATVTIQADSKVYVPLKGPWMGVYAAEANALVVAEELGARVEDVILSYDEKNIFTPVGGGSDGTTASAWVMKEAAVRCKKTLLELAAQSRTFSGGGMGFGAPPSKKPPVRIRPEDLDTKDTMVYLKSDPSKAYPFGKFIGDEGFGDHDLDITATYFGRPPATTWNQGGRVLDVMNASFCEVAVDPETGETEVLKYVVVCDPGKVLRMTSFEGQLHQAMFFSHGGLMEEFIYDKATGVKLSSNMFEYKKPTMMDLGPIETDAVETRSGNACYGASGISHCMAAPQLPVAAIQHAIGKFVETPATPDRVLKALGKV